MQDSMYAMKGHNGLWWGEISENAHVAWCQSGHMSSRFLRLNCYELVGGEVCGGFVPTLLRPTEIFFDMDSDLDMIVPRKDVPFALRPHSNNYYNRREWYGFVVSTSNGTAHAEEFWVPFRPGAALVYDAYMVAEEDLLVGRPRLLDTT
jgi:hypothetical protein